MRIADLAGWLGPASLALGIACIASPRAENLVLALGIAATLSFGIAHGALDHELPQQLAGASRSVTARIAITYAGILGVAFAVFLAAPIPMLALFLIISIMHFGTADVAFAQSYANVHRGNRVRVRARVILLGAFPIVAPIVAHPQAALALVPVELLPSHGWQNVQFVLLGAITLAVIAATISRMRRAQAPRWYRCELAVALAAFVLVPPLVAFVLYFGWWHAVRHLVRLSATYGVDAYAPLTATASRRLAAFGLRTLPMTITAFILGGLLATAFGRALPLPLLLLALGFAVTVPHTFAVRYFNRTTALIRA